MILNARQWDSRRSGQKPLVICLHGVALHGGIYRELAKGLDAFDVVALDLRGHGDSGKEPPWNLEAHVSDVRETVEALGREPVGWIAHSFGGRVALSLRSTVPELMPNIVLLEPGLQVDPHYALRKAEVERLDWSFVSAEGAIRALIKPDVPEAAHAAIREFVLSDLIKGQDGGLRFSFSPASVVVAWSEMVRPVPEVFGTDALIIQSERAMFEHSDHECSDLLRQAQTATVPHGHNIPWEAPAESAALIGAFFESRLREGHGRTSPARSSSGS